MIHNAMVNTPDDWAIQLFVNQDWVEKELLEYHQGLKRLFKSKDRRRIHITPLPSDLANKKPNAVLRDEFVWQHLVAERVFIFSGHGALCANSWKSMKDFYGYDYVGIPWGAFDGKGGSGTDFSLRRRTAMLDAIQRHRGNDNKGVAAHQEDRFFVSTLLQLNEEAGYEKYKVASKEVSEWFGGTNRAFENGTLREEHEWGPIVVHGTQEQLSDDERNAIIGKCQEIKVIFPSLHNPSCFGAKPNPAECAASLGFDPPCPTTSTPR